MLVPRYICLSPSLLVSFLPSSLMQLNNNQSCCLCRAMFVFFSFSLSFHSLLVPHGIFFLLDLPLQFCTLCNLCSEMHTSTTTRQSPRLSLLVHMWTSPPLTGTLQWVRRVPLASPSAAQHSSMLQPQPGDAQQEPAAQDACGTSAAPRAWTSRRHCAPKRQSEPAR